MALVAATTIFVIFDKLRASNHIHIPAKPQLIADVDLRIANPAEALDRAKTKRARTLLPASCACASSAARSRARTTARVTGG